MLPPSSLATAVSVSGCPSVTLVVDAASVTLGFATTGPSTENATGSDVRAAPAVSCATALNTCVPGPTDVTSENGSLVSDASGAPSIVKSTRVTKPPVSVTVATSDTLPLPRLDSASETLSALSSVLPGGVCVVNTLNAMPSSWNHGHVCSTMSRSAALAV